MPEIEVLPWRRTNILAVRVYPSPGRPHYLKKLSFPGGVFVRVGSTNRQADAALIEEMRHFARQESSDEQPIPELNSEAVDFRVASESFAPQRKLQRADLRALRLLTKHQRTCRPSAGGCCSGERVTGGSSSPKPGFRPGASPGRIANRFWTRSRSAAHRRGPSRRPSGSSGSTWRANH